MRHSKTLRGDHCYCNACGEYFNSTGAFDKHRIGKFMPLERRCRLPEEMRAAGMSQTENGFWVRVGFHQSDRQRVRQNEDRGETGT